jgi:hypothetical protein
MFEEIPSVIDPVHCIKKSVLGHRETDAHIINEEILNSVAEYGGNYLETYMDRICSNIS